VRRSGRPKRCFLETPQVGASETVQSISRLRPVFLCGARLVDLSLCTVSFNTSTCKVCFRLPLKVRSVAYVALAILFLGCKEAFLGGVFTVNGHLNLGSDICSVYVDRAEIKDNLASKRR
jgi:hypothetical protein